MSSVRLVSPLTKLPAPGRNAIDIAEELRTLGVDETWVHEITRRKILYDQAIFTQRCEQEPEKVKQEMLDNIRVHLPKDYPIDEHFTPKYRPWSQRIAFVPDADLFKGISAGLASVVTGEIDCFVENGVRLKSGEVLEADIIVTATGFNLNVLGGIQFAVDGKKLNWADTVTYRGMMFTGVPNLVWVFGYFRASWTLRADLLADFVCKLFKHMDEKGARKVTVALRPEDKDMPLLPFIGEDNFNPGYLQRGMHLWPKRGDKPEWMHNQDYWSEKDEIPATNLDDAAFVYEATNRKAYAA